MLVKMDAANAMSDNRQVFMGYGITDVPDREVDCGFEPKFIMICMPNTSCVVWQSTWNPTQFYQFTNPSQYTGWYTVQNGTTIEAVTSTGFRLSSAAWTSVTSSTVFIAVGDIE